MVSSSWLAPTPATGDMPRPGRLADARVRGRPAREGARVRGHLARGCAGGTTPGPGVRGWDDARPGRRFALRRALP
ncbi:hypothetical protein GCM10014719_44340 [Planomonospora parontospora subsp. antibiotica]|nr:hypothetical protein GCM10014719_44340 [Planomonospora parontospora subsp. antibiotica]